MFHLYDEDVPKARKFLAEGWQSNIPMPPMPAGNQWPSVEKLKVIEQKIRSGEGSDIDNLCLDAYWADIGRALEIFALTKGTPSEAASPQVESLSKAMSSDFFRP